MRKHRAALPLPTSTVQGQLTLSTRDTPATLAGGQSDASEAALLNFDEADVIADIVPVPPSVPPALRDALDRAMRVLGTDLDQWLHEGHPALRGASPFEALVAGDAIGVLRALLRDGNRIPGRRTRMAPEEHRPTHLRLVR